MESVIASSFNDRAGNPQKRTLELSRGMASSAGNGQRSNQQHLFRRRIFQSGARRHSAIPSARAKSCLLAQAIEQFCPSPLNRLNRHASITATTPQAARKQPDRELVRQAAIELWGTPGPPDHLSNLSICREVAQWLKKNDQAAEISDATILRAVGRK